MDCLFWSDCLTALDVSPGMGILQFGNLHRVSSCFYSSGAIILESLILSDFGTQRLVICAEVDEKALRN